MTMTDARPIKTGRPLKNPATGRKYYEGKLYALLLDRLKNHVHATGKLDVASLSKALSVSKQWLYLSMTDDKLSRRVAGLLITESKGTIEPKDLAPFLID